jgi:hypothetical protein
LPLIALREELPAGLETTAERLVGVVVLILAVRVLVDWIRGGYRADRHRHRPAAVHRHLHAGAHAHEGRQPDAARAAAIGILHGVAGTGAIVILLITALPAQGTALAALLVFAPMSVLSMALFTGSFAWLFTRRIMDPVFRRVLMPMLGGFGLVFGAWYAGLG